MFDLAGKCALVTGASGGIGAAIARRLARQGAVVCLSGTRKAALEDLAREIGQDVHVCPADLSTPDGPQTLVDAAAAAMGALDILVSNAGVTRDTLVMRMTDEDLEKVLAINLTAAFRLTRASLRIMMKKRWGRIIAVTSVVGTTGNAGQANYAASKAGLTGFVKAVAQEVGSRGITCNCIAPGFIETDMTAGLGEQRREAVLRSIPAGRFGHPDDVAAAAAFLASSESAYVTGQTLHVNGGMAMP
jgi:3-oxoacyl-[acyl-carrier protein] reductase